MLSQSVQFGQVCRQVRMWAKPSASNPVKTQIWHFPSLCVPTATVRTKPGLGRNGSHAVQSELASLEILLMLRSVPSREISHI
jgi:hypothetical protein